MEQMLHGTAQQLTSSGRSAIATIRLTGELSALDTLTSLFRAANRKRVQEQSLNALCFGIWGDPGEDVVLCRISENSVEVTCHGGAAAVARILDDAAGRGFLNHAVASDQGRLGDQSLCILDVLTRARTQRTAEILLEQASGLWPQFALDVTRLSPDKARQRIHEALTWSEFGRHLAEPWNVVLCGRPNVGKSSLMNALAGFTRSIVSDQAGTTRDLVTLETAIDGWPVRITDTAGVRETSDLIEQAGVQHTLSAIDQADLVLIVLDGSEPEQLEDQLLLKLLVKRRLVIAHKSDLPVWTQASLPAESLPVSSASGQGVESLLRAISAALMPVLPSPGQLIPVTPWLDSELRVMLRHACPPECPPLL